jgi:hypothetical protein
MVSAFIMDVFRCFISISRTCRQKTTNRLTLHHPGWRSWLRHCIRNRKFAGSIPDGVIGFFHWHNPVGRTMALGSTQPLTEMSTRNVSWGVKAAGA